MFKNLSLALYVVIVALSVVLIHCDQSFAATTDALEDNQLGDLGRPEGEEGDSSDEYSNLESLPDDDQEEGSGDSDEATSSLQNFLDHRDSDEASDSESDSEETDNRTWRKSTHIERTPVIGMVTGITCPQKAEEHKEPNQAVKLYFHKGKREMTIEQAEDAEWAPEDVDALVESGFDPKKKTVLYMSGWRNNADSGWLLQARKDHDKLAEVMGKSPYNLIVIDWSSFFNNNYGISVSYVPYIARTAANLIEQLIDRHGFKADQLQIVCYSLSTHIAGLIGRNISQGKRGLVRQITAMDPTGVCFHRRIDHVFDSEYSLRPTDAKLVVARHYDMHQLGSGRPIGGLDIFVNGGKNQPLMKLRKLFNVESYITSFNSVLRHHFRPMMHEEESFDMRSDCDEIAYACASFEKFKQGQCADCGARNESCYYASTIGNFYHGIEPVEVGYKMNTEMYQTTGSSKFCTYNYQIVAKLKPEASVEVQKLFQDGRFKFDVSRRILIEPKYRLEEDTDHVTFTRLLRLERKIPFFSKRIRMGFVHKPALRVLESLSINFMSAISPEERKKNSFRYCADMSHGPALVPC